MAGEGLDAEDLRQISVFVAGLNDLTANTGVEVAARESSRLFIRGDGTDRRNTGFDIEAVEDGPSTVVQYRLK